MLSPLHRVLSAGLPVVIVSAALDLPASSKLSYIVNDDEKMGESAAAEIARLIHGKGSIVLVGIGLEAIHLVQANKRYFPPDIAARLTERMARSNLTRREHPVLQLVAKGLTNKESGEPLALATIRREIT